MKNLFRQIISFVGISGVGWLLDFALYNLLSYTVLDVFVANICSSMVAVCLVFFVSTRKIFDNKKEGLNVKLKFAIYIIYQLALIFVASALIKLINNGIITWIQVDIIVTFAPVIGKILVTPFTMTLNFIVMKLLLEKI